jgi:peroxiredoxin
MARVASTMLPLGTLAPDFQLPDVFGERISLATMKGKQGLLVMFICKHCPFVKHVEAQLAQIGKDYEDKNLGIVAISANDASNYPDDAPDKLQAMFPCAMTRLRKLPRLTQQLVRRTFFFSMETEV